MNVRLLSMLRTSDASGDTQSSAYSCNASRTQEFAMRRRLQHQHLLRRRIQLLLQRLETILDRRPAIEFREFVVERLAGFLVRRIQTRVRAGVGELNLVFELLKVL